MAITLIAIPAWNYWGRRVAPAVLLSEVSLPKDLSARIEGFRFARTDGDRTLFSIAASTNLGFKDNRQQLEDVDVIIEGRNPGDPQRRIHGRRCEYDQTSGDILFMGDVRFQLDEQSSGQTDELLYRHEAQMVLSDKPTELQRTDGTTGRAGHIEYFLDTGTLLARNQVQVHRQGQSLSAGRLRFDSKASRIWADESVRLISPAGSFAGEHVEVELTAKVYKPVRAVVTDKVSGTIANRRSPNESWIVDGTRADLQFGDAGVLQAAQIQGGTRVEKTGDEPQVLTAENITAAIAGGRVTRVTATTGAEMLLAADRSLTADRIEIEGEGGIRSSGPSVLRLADTRIDGRDFRVTQGDLVHFATDLRATIRSSNRETSADRTDARFDRAAGRLVELTQTGSFQFSEGARRGRSERASMADRTGVIRLSGNASVVDDKTRLDADEIVIEGNEAFEASGSVRTLATDRAAPVLVHADHASGKGGTATYDGRVQVWRDRFHIRGDKLNIDRTTNALTAVGRIESRLDLIRISADLLQFDDQQHEVRYSGQVRAQHGGGTIQAERMTVQLEGDAVRRVIAEGSVEARQLDQTGRGDHAVYDLPADTITLSGPNAFIEQPSRGRIQGTQLVMQPRIERGAVAGTAESRTTTKYKVVKP